MSPEEAKSRSERARLILEDPLFSESLAANVNAAIALCSQAKDEKEAWRACMVLKAVMDATKSIATHMETNKIMDFNQKKRWF